MSNIDNILDKTQYGIDDNFVDMYKNLAFHQASEQEFHIFSEDYIPFYFIAGLSSVFAFLLMSYGTHILYSFFLAGATFIIFITSWLHLNQDAISNCFNLANSKERVEKFENKWIFNEKNFLSILEEINFHSFSENDKNLIIDMITTKKANLEALSLIYNQLVLQKKQSFLSKIKKKEDSENNNFQFFNQ